MLNQILPDGEILSSQATVDSSNVPAGAPLRHYASPNATAVRTGTTLDSLFSDDFGGTALNAIANNWTVFDGGILANPQSLNPANPQGILQQGAIGSNINMGNGIDGPANSALSVANSALTVSMGTTNGAELLLLSNQVFAGKEDILVLLAKSQPIAANSIFVGLVEVDSATWVPLLNPNLAGEFTNRGGVEFGLTTTTTAYQCEAIGDSSPAKAVGAVGAAAALTTMQEYLIEIDSRDVIAQSKTIDAIAGNLSTGSRVSSQCPNDRKLYKLALRFRNVSTPASNTTITIDRILVSDNYEQRVQVSSGEGDGLAVKGLPVNLVANAANVSFIPVLIAGQGAATYHKLISAATTNATSVKTTQGNVSGGHVMNTNTSMRYLKFYNKASAPTVGTDVPIFTIELAQNVPINLADVFGPVGCRFTAGIAYAITGGQADNDTTAVGAGDVVVNIVYT